MTSIQPLEHVSFQDPDEVREGANWRLELVNLAGGAQVGRITVQPGWRWSQDVKPVAGTDLCMAPHQQYQLSGHMHVVMSDARRKPLLLPVKHGIRYVLTGRSERCARIPVTAVRASIRWEHCDGIRSDH